MLAAEIAAGEMPSAVWRVERRGEVVAEGALGFAVAEPEEIAASTETLYDLASLTKPLVTTTLTLQAAHEGKLTLDEPLGAHLPELLRHAWCSGTTWRDALSHRAGFEAWYPLYVEGYDREAYLRAILSRPPAYAPGSSVVYSDLGFVLLFLALERVFDEDFEELARRRVLVPFGAGDCGFRPPPDRRMRIAATERGNEKEREMVSERGLSFDGWRDGIIWGEANDGNAYHLGGVSGHAGLFGDANGVARLASAYLAGRGDLPELLARDAVHCQAADGGERRGLGWQLRSASNPGAPLSRGAYGHSGFTGTSVWVDPAGELVVVLLTNRIHPRVQPSRIQAIRTRLNVAAAYLAAGLTVNVPLE